MTRKGVGWFLPTAKPAHNDKLISLHSLPTVNVLNFVTKVSDKIAYANSVDPDKTVPLIRVYSVCHSMKYFKKQLHKKLKHHENIPI